MKQADERKLPWLESYVDQSLTFTSWKKIETKMSQVLKQGIEKKLMDPVQRQILFQLVGNDFVNKNFSSYTNSPQILDNVRNEEKEKKRSEMKSYVTSVLENAVQKKSDNSKTSSVLTPFSQDLRNLIEFDYHQQLTEGKSKKRQKTTGLSESQLMEILSYDPSLIHTLIPKLQNSATILSDDLRVIFWNACIINKEKPKNKKNVEKIKEKFIQLCNRNNGSYRDSTDVMKEISTVVKKVYKDSNCLKSLDSEENIRASVNILNVCHMYGRQFQSHYAYYSVVIQQVYFKNKANDEDHAISAMMLEKLLRLCLLSNDQVIKLSDKVLQILMEVDNELVVHMKQKLNMDFPTGAADSDRRDRTEESFNGKRALSVDSKNRLGFPATYVYKWISHGFVSILRPNSLFFIWDQLYLNKWEMKVLEDICLTLLGLLKPWFMLSKNQAEVEKVFLEEPSCLYLLDIRKAFGHIRRKGRFLDVPGMNRNIKYDHLPKPSTPVTPPKPVVRSPTPPPRPPPTVFVPWVSYNKDKAKDPTQAKAKVDLPFDLYIDSVRFIPDNATVVKVTGKVLNMYFGQKDKFVKFQSYPDLPSFWRYPKFKMKQVVNRDSIPMNPDTVIMIRVYTVEQHSKKICVLGSCLFGPFSNKHGKQASLRVGGHQIRVRHGIPDPDFTVEHMLASHMDDNPVIPGVTILLRVLPHQKEYVSAPEYETNYYRSELAKPNESEKRLFKHYQESKDFTMSVRDVGLLLCGQASAGDEALSKLIQQQLQKEGSDVEDFPYQRYVHYNQEHGIMVLADKASGLPLFLEGRYLQCLVQIYPGEETRIGNGKNQISSFITEDLELESPQRAPDWSDQPVRVKPEYDDKSFIFVTLYGLRPRFDPTTGKVYDKEGREPKFNLQHAIAWSATTCFDKGAACAGTHHIPLLKGRPPDDIIEKLGYLPLDYVCKKFKSQVKVFDAASIEITVWDGRFAYNECPPLPTHVQLLNISANPEKYIKASEKTSGATAADLLKQGLSNKSEFSRYKNQIVKLLNTIFKENIDDSLRKAGYSTTI